MNKEEMRMNFEEWCVSIDLFGRVDLERISGTDYKYADIDSAWLAWQASYKHYNQQQTEN